VDFKPTLTLLKQAVVAWWNDQAPSKGAAIAYYSMFSIAPLLFIVITVAGLIHGPDAVRGAVFGQVADLMGESGAEAIREMLANVSEPDTGSMAAMVSTALLVFGATTVFGQLQTALDTIWEVPAQAKAEKHNAVWTFIKGRLLSFGLVLALAFLIVVSLAVSFAMLVVVFAAIYKFMPRARIEWRDVWVGAAVTALLFSIGKFLIGLYLGKSDVGASFGAFGSIIVVMVWVYYSAQIFLLGAEFTWAYAHHSGSRQSRPVEASRRAMPARAPAPPIPAPRRRVAPLALIAAFAGGAALRLVRRR